MDRPRPGSSLAALLVALGAFAAACPAGAPVVAPPSAFGPAAEVPRPRKLLAAPPDRRDAIPDRTWCRRACRHLAALVGGPTADADVDACGAICQRWGSGDRVRCVLEATTVEEAGRCAW